jgi:5-methylcytosine-specific restriction endonuclease McrA
MLDKPCLVLNKSWHPVRIESIRTSLARVFSGNSFLLNEKDYMSYDWDAWQKIPIEQDDQIITTTSGCIKSPHITILKNYNKIPKIRLKLNKKNILLRDRYTCQYTGKKLLFEEASLDHVLPRSRGGKTEWTNLVTCCKKINLQKADKTPQEAGLSLISNPVKPTGNILFARNGRTIYNCWLKFLDKETLSYLEFYKII